MMRSQKKIFTVCLERLVTMQRIIDMVSGYLPDWTTGRRWHRIWFFISRSGTANEMQRTYVCVLVTFAAVKLTWWQACIHREHFALSFCGSGHKLPEERPL